MAMDYLVKVTGARNDDAKLEFKAQTISFRWDTTQVLLAKPQTMMNLSGESVGEIMRYYKIPIEQLIVVHDDMDQPFDSIRIKAKSGDGGHNGVKSLIEHLGTTEFLRVKIGVGRPPHAEMDPADYVLQNFSKQEQAGLPEILNRATDALECIVFDGVTAAMNRFNTKVKESD